MYIFGAGASLCRRVVLRSTAIIHVTKANSHM